MRINHSADRETEVQSRKGAWSLAPPSGSGCSVTSSLPLPPPHWHAHHQPTELALGPECQGDSSPLGPHPSSYPD